MATMNSRIQTNNTLFNKKNMQILKHTDDLNLTEKSFPAIREAFFRASVTSEETGGKNRKDDVNEVLSFLSGSTRQRNCI